MSPPTPKAVSVATWLYRALFLAFPPAFRYEYGPELSRAFAEVSRVRFEQRGAWGVVAAWMRSALDVVLQATREWFDVLRRPIERMSGSAGSGPDPMRPRRRFSFDQTGQDLRFAFRSR